MLPRMFIMLGLFLLVVGGIAAVKFFQVKAIIAQFASMTPPPEAVTSSKAEEIPWQETIEVIGSFSPVQGVTVSGEEGGKIVKINFDSGAEVKEGDLLVQQDVSVEEAQLVSAKAKADVSLINLERQRALRKMDASTQSELDNADSLYKQAQADADALSATINRKTIRAPFTGRVGIRMVQLGQYLSPGTAVVTLQTLDKVYVDFSLPQQHIAEVSVGQKILLTVDAFADKTFEGKITALSPLIDPTARNITAQATLANPGELLRPGMYTHVSLYVGEPKPRITIPLTAINHAPYGDSVFIITTMKDPSGKEYLGVQQKFVKTGPTRGDQVSVEGLNAGVEVVTSGLFKLRPGAAVSVNNSVMPTNNPAPKPSES